MCIKIPAEVYRTIEAIRQSGAINMLDRSGVQVIANDMEAYKTVIWLEDHKTEYGRGIFEGFESDDHQPDLGYDDDQQPDLEEDDGDPEAIEDDNYPESSDYSKDPYYQKETR